MPIKSKFWAVEGESDSEEDEQASPVTPSTPEFINEALHAGFTLDQLSRAEQALDSGKKISPGGLQLSKSIVSTLVQRKIKGVPWQTSRFSTQNAG